MEIIVPIHKKENKQGELLADGNKLMYRGNIFKSCFTQKDKKGTGNTGASYGNTQEENKNVTIQQVEEKIIDKEQGLIK